MKLFAVALLLVIVAMPSHTTASPVKRDSADRLVFGFLPIVSTEKLLARFGPLTDYLASKLDRPVKFETARDYMEFSRRTNHEKRYDIVFTAPHFYYSAQRQAGYQVIVRVNAPRMTAIIVAHKDGVIKSVQDLKNRSIALPDRRSLGALLVRNHISRSGLRPGKDVKLVVTPSHNAALISGYKGVTDAAGLMMTPFRRAGDEVKRNMKIIATTRGTPHMPISVSADLPDRVKARLKQVFINMQQTNEGKRLLKHLSWPGFVAANPSEYDQMEWAARLIKR